MSKGFRQADVRRLEEIFNHDLPAPYAAEGSLTNKYQCLQMKVMDPEAPHLTVCHVRFDYDEGQKKGTQPPVDEVDRIAVEFATLCREYELTREQRAAEQARLVSQREKHRQAREDALKPPPKAEPEEKTEMEA